MARSRHIGHLAVLTSLANLVQSQLVKRATSEAFQTVTPTCTVQSAATGFIVPQTWCDCTNEGTTATSTYSTMFGHTGAAACDWTIVDAGQASNTISPTSASLFTETAYAGGPFYNELAWCAAADGIYPLMTDPASLSASRACSYTARPTSTIHLYPLGVTDCISTTPTTDSDTFIVVPSQACACVQEAASVSIFYPFTSGCEFNTIPSSTVAFTTSIVAPVPTPSQVGQSCGSIKSTHDCATEGSECSYQCDNGFAVSSQCGELNHRRLC